MNSLLDQLFSSFGGYGILLIVALALVVWGLAHFSAQPGTSVSILWGLVTYVKTSPQAQQPSPQARQPYRDEIVSSPENEASTERESSLPDRVQAIYESGKNLIPVLAREHNQESAAETDILLSKDWLDGADERLSRLTDAQKTKELEKVFSGKTILIEGVVENVSHLSTSIDMGDFGVRVYTNNVGRVQRETLESLHRGDATRLRARPADIQTTFGQHTVFCEDPFDIERTVT